LVVVAYVGLATAPFVYAATHREFWQSLAPLATLIWLALVVGVVVGRRWAWLLAVIIEIAVLLSWPFSAEVRWYAVALNTLSLAVLVSPPMRAHVKTAA
jgi:energy-coupling factor transporter transmembrane protein EcfT